MTDFSYNINVFNEGITTTSIIVDKSLFFNNLTGVTLDFNHSPFVLKYIIVNLNKLEINILNNDAFKSVFITIMDLFLKEIENKLSFLLNDYSEKYKTGSSLAIIDISHITYDNYFDKFEPFFREDEDLAGYDVNGQFDYLTFNSFPEHIKKFYIALRSYVLFIIQSIEFNIDKRLIGQYKNFIFVNGEYGSEDEILVLNNIFTDYYSKLVFLKDPGFYPKKTIY